MIYLAIAFYLLVAYEWTMLTEDIDVANGCEKSSASRLFRQVAIFPFNIIVAFLVRILMKMGLIE